MNLWIHWVSLETCWFSAGNEGTTPIHNPLWLPLRKTSGSYPKPGLGHSISHQQVKPKVPWGSYKFSGDPNDGLFLVSHQKSTEHPTEGAWVEFPFNANPREGALKERGTQLSEVPAPRAAHRLARRREGCHVSGLLFLCQRPFASIC